MSILLLFGAILIVPRMFRLILGVNTFTTNGRKDHVYSKFAGLVVQLSFSIKLGSFALLSEADFAPFTSMYSFFLRKHDKREFHICRKRASECLTDFSLSLIFRLRTCTKE